MNRKYLFVVSTVNQVNNSKLIIEQLDLKGVFEFVVFGARTKQEIVDIELAINSYSFFHKRSFWLLGLSFFKARKLFQKVAETEYVEAFFFSYYTYYNLLSLTLSKAGARISIAEEGLGTYRVIIEAMVPPLPLSLKPDQNKGFLKNTFFRVLDYINNLFTKKQFVSLMQYIPFFRGMGSRPFKVYRIVACYPKILSSYFESQIQNQLSLNKTGIHVENKFVLESLVNDKRAVIFASQPLIWDAFSDKDLAVFLSSIAEAYQANLYFFAHPRDSKQQIDKLVAKLADVEKVRVLAVQQRQDIESIVNFTKPRALLGLSTSALLYCRDITNCESITDRLPSTSRTAEILYHDLIYQEVIKMLDDKSDIH